MKYTPQPVTLTKFVAHAWLVQMFDTLPFCSADTSPLDSKRSFRFYAYVITVPLRIKESVFSGLLNECCNALFHFVER